MAEDRPGGEPTEEPTPKRLRDARRQGQVARSRDLSGAVTFVAGFGALALTATGMVGLLAELMTRTLRSCGAGGAAPASLGAALDEGLGVLWRACGPVLAVVFVAAALSGFVQVGGLFTLEPLAPKLERLNPLTGLKNLFGRRSFFELGKALVKAVAVAVIAYEALFGRARDLALATRGGPWGALRLGGQIAYAILWRTALAFAVIAAMDFLYQRRAFLKQLRMTTYEVKQERKQSEGDPHHKAARQRLHRDILQHDMLEAVRTADCVIVNPDHIAVALRYDRAAMQAPEVVAKGERLLAERIKAIAREHGVPILRDVPLARALSRVELGEEIPDTLYEAVAEVLRFVYGRSAAG